MTAKDAFDLTKTYAYLENGGAAPLLDASKFWQEMMSGQPKSPEIVRAAGQDGWLAAKYAFKANTPHWEMHPAGDELLIMLSGHMELVLEQDGSERVVELRAGSAFLVPKGTWHRQVLRQAGDYVGVTYGKGTQHKPL